MARQAPTDTPHVSVVVLVYDEVDSVEPLHRELMGVLAALGTSFEVLYIDDGSRDGTTEKLGQTASRDARVRVVSFRRNFGQTAAVQAGIDHSRGAVLLFLDGDMQNDPHDIPHLLQKIDEGYDVVSGWRRDRRDDASRVIPSKIALSGEMHRFIPVFAAMIGARITELPVNHRPRTYGKSKHSFTRASRVMLDLVTVKLLGSHSTQPLYLFGFAAFAMWAVALVLAAIVILQKVMPPYVYAHNNPLLLLSVVLAIVGVQFILIGLSIRMYQESQSKPTYVVREILEKSPHRQPATNGRPAVRTR
ncbi:MAG: glycosyltransferase family 2 protein [Chloroflexi bacterium]|nr:MAG: glycosyltransferase family 2 protein [Chloroflexota bacterium]